MGYTLPICILPMVVALLFMVNGSNTLGHLKGFDFQKELDGSIIGIEDVIKQTTFPGRLSLMCT